MTYLAAALAALLCPENSWASKNPTYIVTNDDVAKAKGNTVTFYLPGLHGSAPTLTQKVVVATKGTGVGGGGFATTQINVLHDPSQNCVYVADGGSNDIAGIKISTRELAGNFKGSKNDLGAPYGVALAMNDNYLYAGFTGSGTIATFQVLPGCTLGFVGDTYLIGMNGGSLNGMALNGNILVVTYGDGSIESFNIASGMPAPNGDLQDSTGYGDDNLPVAVDISKYGHFAIFGDASTSAVVEVSDISSGRLTPTVAYNLGAGDSSDVRLSPDQHLLYIANNISFKVTAAFFDDATGVVSAGCTSSVLHGAKNSWYVAGLSTLYTLGTGSVLYVAEGGGQSSYIGILQVESSGGQCTLTESSQSPVIDKHSSGLMSIGTFLPRPF
jgi:6-phosphogluconolactonase (cycloisomerase 2 family)